MDRKTSRHGSAASAVRERMLMVGLLLIFFFLARSSLRSRQLPHPPQHHLRRPRHQSDDVACADHRHAGDAARSTGDGGRIQSPVDGHRPAADRRAGTDRDDHTDRRGSRADQEAIRWERRKIKLLLARIAAACFLVRSHRRSYIYRALASTLGVCACALVRACLSLASSSSGRRASWPWWPRRFGSWSASARAVTLGTTTRHNASDVGVGGEGREEVSMRNRVLLPRRMASRLDSRPAIWLRRSAASGG